MDSENINKRKNIKKCYQPSPSSSPPAKLFQPSKLEEEILKGDPTVTNLALGHEIALNDEFILPRDDSNQNSILDPIKKAYYDSIQAAIAENSDFGVLIDPLKDIKSLLEGLLPKSKVTQVHIELKERLDIPLIQQQMKAETFSLTDLKEVFCLVFDIMGKVCAPVRDSNLRELRKLLSQLETTKIALLVSKTFDLINLMKIDMANFSIQAIRPLIKQQQVNYERQKMQDYIDANPETGLNYTKHGIVEKIYLTRKNSKKFIVIRKANVNQPYIISKT